MSWLALIPAVCCLIVLFASCIIYYFKKDPQIQARTWWVVLSFGFINFSMIFSAFLRILNRSFLPCFAVRWSSMILMNTLGTFSMFQGWAIKVKSDRGMRTKFHWTIRPSCLLIASITTFLYSCCILGLVDKFDQSLRMQTDCDCFFLLPWVAHTPFFVLCVAVNVCTAILTKKSSTEESTSDSFGIHSERTTENFTMGPLLALQIVFAQLCLMEKIIKYRSISNFLYILPPFNHAMINVVTPAVQVLIGIHQKNKWQYQSIYDVKRHGKRNILTVVKVGCTVDMSRTPTERNIGGLILEILENADKVVQFKKHAREHFCAESVDFCIEVFQYKTFQMEIDKTRLYKKFLSILEEFVVNNAPSEVNISSSQKSHIIQYKNESLFNCSDETTVLNIFDTAQLEVAKMLGENLLVSFTQAKNAFL